MDWMTPDRCDQSRITLIESQAKSEVFPENKSGHLTRLEWMPDGQKP